MAKFHFSFAWFKTPAGKTTLWIVLGLVFFFVVYRLLSGGGNSSAGTIVNQGPSDSAIQATAAQNLATIQANAQTNQAQIAADAATAQAVLAAGVANNQTQAGSDQAALALQATLAGISASLVASKDQNATNLATANVAANTILGQGAQQNQLLLGQAQIQASMFSEQLQANTQQSLIYASASLKKKSPKSVKHAFADALSSSFGSSYSTLSDPTLLSAPSSLSGATSLAGAH